TPAEVLEEMGRVVAEYAGVKYWRIEKLGLQTPVWDDNHPGTTYLFAASFPRGKGKFHPLEYVPAVEIPDEEYPFILTTGRLLDTGMAAPSRPIQSLHTSTRKRASKSAPPTAPA